MSNHNPNITSSNASGSFSENANTTGSNALHNLSGTMNFTDSDRRTATGIFGFVFGSYAHDATAADAVGVKG